MWPPLVCSECQNQFFYEAYIDADDGLGERPVCMDCYPYVVTMGLMSKPERSYDTNYHDPLGPSLDTASVEFNVDCPWCPTSDESTERLLDRTLDMAAGSDGPSKNSRADRLASPDSQG